MALPCGTTGSLYPSFLPARLVGLTVKHPSDIALTDWLPTNLRVPLKASVTLLEATTPVKLPTKQCPLSSKVRSRIGKGWYFNSDSKRPDERSSQSPTYPTHRISKTNVKL